MQQRVSLCRALIHDPSVLLMDEPFAALDAMTREELGFELMRIWDADKKTVIFVTHNISEAILLADRVVAMTPRPGRIARVLDIALAPPRTIAMSSRETFKLYSEEIRDVIYQGKGAGSHECGDHCARRRRGAGGGPVHPQGGRRRDPGRSSRLWPCGNSMAREFQIPAWLLPAPSLIGESMLEWRSELLGHSLVTLYETLVGFALAIAIKHSAGGRGGVFAAFAEHHLSHPARAPVDAKAPSPHCWRCGSGSGRCRRSWWVFLVCFFTHHRRHDQRAHRRAEAR